MDLQGAIRKTFNSYRRVIRNYLNLIDSLLDAIESGELEEVRRKLPVLRKQVAKTQMTVEEDL